MTYKLPPPAWMGDIPGYTAEHLQEAYTAGAASRDAEIECATRLGLALEQQRNELRAQNLELEKQIEGWMLDQKENLKWQCNLQAQVFRKDALLQRVLGALKGLRQGDVAVWSLGGSARSNLAIIAIKEELSK